MGTIATDLDRKRLPGLGRGVALRTLRPRMDRAAPRRRPQALWGQSVPPGRDGDRGGTRTRTPRGRPWYGRAPLLHPGDGLDGESPLSFPPGPHPGGASIPLHLSPLSPVPLAASREGLGVYFFRGGGEKRTTFLRVIRGLHEKCPSPLSLPGAAVERMAWG